MTSPHGGCTIELMERDGNVGLFECGECGQTCTLPVDEDGEPTDPGKDGPTT